MGCVSSNLLNRSSEDDEFGTSLGVGVGVGHHIVSLTSTTYGFLSTLDPPPLIPTTTNQIEEEDHHHPVIINSEDLDTTCSFRFPVPKSTCEKEKEKEKENYNPNQVVVVNCHDKEKYKNPPNEQGGLLEDRFERICPPNGEKRVVIYTTTLRGVRRTFEACNAVRAVFDAFGVKICERDLSMDSGFKEELRELLFNLKLKDKNNNNNNNNRSESESESALQLPLPRVFIQGFYIGGAEELFNLAEKDAHRLLPQLLQGLPTKPPIPLPCQGCGDMRFLPCFRCNGSCKIILGRGRGTTAIVVKCTDCNENGLVFCPLCSTT